MDLRCPLVLFHKTDLDFSCGCLHGFDPRRVEALSCFFDPPPEVPLHCCGPELGHCVKLAVAPYLVLSPSENRLQGHQPRAPRWQLADDQLRQTFLLGPLIVGANPGPYGLGGVPRGLISEQDDETLAPVVLCVPSTPPER